MTGFPPFLLLPLLVLLHLHPSAAPRVTIIEPYTGATTTPPSNVRVRMRVTASPGEILPRTLGLEVDGVSRATTGVNADGSADVLLTAVEPGTHSVRVWVPTRDDTNASSDLSTATTIFDTVPADVERVRPPRQRPRYVWHGACRRRAAREPAFRRRRLVVAYVGTLKMDGQKTIWLQQMKRLDPRRFEAVYLCLSCPPDEVLGETASGADPGAGLSAGADSPDAAPPDAAPPDAAPGVAPGVALGGTALFTAKLRAAGVHVERDSLSIDAALGNDATFPLNLVHIVRASSAEKDRFDEPQRRFARAFNDTFVSRFRRLGVDILVLANSRLSSDALLVEAAHAAGAVVVMDLPNLHPSPHVIADVLIAPSFFARSHASVHALEREQQGAPTYIINPAVDTGEYYYSDKRRGSAEQRSEEAERDVRVDGGQINVDRTDSSGSGERSRDSNREDFARPDPVDAALGDGASPCLGGRAHVGFVGRLAPEKSVGLFLRAATIVLRECPGARFTVVGDGPQSAALRHYAAFLGLANYVNFTGWLGNGLPSVVASMDVLVNPSLRDSETFCITNVEAMAAGVPVVTFAAGGVLEYACGSATYEEGVAGDEGGADDRVRPQAASASVLCGDNGDGDRAAHIAERPAAADLASGAVRFLTYPSEALKIALRAQNLARRRFNVTRMVSEYSDVYCHHAR